MKEKRKTKEERKSNVMWVHIVAKPVHCYIYIDQVHVKIKDREIKDE